MRKSLLYVAMGFATLTAVAASCGGKVTVDNTAGVGGGFGGTGFVGSGGNPFVVGVGGVPATFTGVGPGVVTSVTGVGPTTTTGFACSCDEVCKITDACGFTGSDCPKLCASASPGILQCICATGPNCSALFGCLGATNTAVTTTTGFGGFGGTTTTGFATSTTGFATGTGGTTTTAFATTTSSGGLSCAQCVNAAATQQCSPLLAQCTTDPECTAYAACASTCGTNTACQAKCALATPKGAADYTTLVNCIFCTNCTQVCPGQVTQQFCGLQPPHP